MSDFFYKAFENAHRGSRELIKSRLEIYLPLISPLKKIYPDGVGLDIGCGRGEWLELLSDNAISVQGIDLDEGMLEACNDLNLGAFKGEGVAHLKKQANSSITIISAFHVAEHIPFASLQAFVGEALRVLKPGGLLIMETPNPENIKVATESFYLDPTHMKPIPSALLSFLPEFYGFERTKILRLQENDALASQENISLLQVIEGVSPDYAVIAQKKADTELLEKFDGFFSQEIGLTLTTLTDKFESRLQRIDAKAAQAEAKAEKAETRANQARANIVQLQSELHSVYLSRSWRITKPLRVIAHQIYSIIK